MGIFDGVDRQKIFERPYPQRPQLDLNAERFKPHGHDASETEIMEAFADPSVYSGSDGVSVIFRHLKRALVHQIKQADYVYGCVAWLTDFDILDALAEKKGVCIVVQKEDFLRPDGLGSSDWWRQKLSVAYEKLPTMERTFIVGLLSRLDQLGNTELDAVRCAGYRRGGGAGKFTPLMHHKFALFAKSHGTEPSPLFDEDQDREASQRAARGEPPSYFFPDPSIVWTGSFNWSDNANRSIENAVVLTEPAIVAAFYKEFQQVAALSESLDWESEYVEPEWRIGT